MMLRFIKNLLRLVQLLLVICGKGIPLYTVIYIVYKKQNPLKSERILQKIGQKIVEVLQYSGPTFIKLGQALSTRPDLTGEVIGRNLALLQDRLPPFPFEKACKQVESDFGMRIEQLFSEFSSTPVAAASIAQVHKAVTLDGKVVAVKILRPKIAQRFQSDLALFGMFVGIMECCFGQSTKRLRLHEVLKMLIELERFELDLRYEAASAEEIKENMRSDSYVRIPEVHWHLTSSHVLTVEWIDGIPVNDRDALLAYGHDLHQVALRLTTTFLKQAYRDGFFHADLHPGNLFVDEKGNIVMIDFGIIGILSKADRLYIAEILYGFIERDYQRVADIHFEAGYVPEDKNRKLFALACRMIGEPIIGRVANKISIAQLLRQLFEVTKQFDMPTQTQLLLLQKTMVTIEGIGMIIHPEVNMWQLAEPCIREIAQQNFGWRTKLHDVKTEVQKMVGSVPEFYREGLQALKSFNRKKPESTLAYKQKNSRLKYIAACLLGVILGIILHAF